MKRGGGENRGRARDSRKEPNPFPPSLKPFIS